VLEVGLHRRILKCHFGEHPIKLSKYHFFCIIFSHISVWLNRRRINFVLFFYLVNHSSHDAADTAVFSFHLACHPVEKVEVPLLLFVIHTYLLGGLNFCFGAY
jgi:hypothetical protein